MGLNSAVAIAEASGSNKLDIKRLIVQDRLYVKTLEAKLDGAISDIGKRPFSSRIKPVIWPLVIGAILVTFIYSVFRPPDNPAAFFETL